MNLCYNDSLGPSSICITNGTIGYNLGEYTENPFEPSELYFSSSQMGLATCPNHLRLGGRAFELKFPQWSGIGIFKTG